jgi:hypothetical protein
MQNSHMFHRQLHGFSLSTKGTPQSPRCLRRQIDLLVHHFEDVKDFQQRLEGNLPLPGVDKLYPAPWGMGMDGSNPRKVMI